MCPYVPLQFGFQATILHTQPVGSLQTSSFELYVLHSFCGKRPLYASFTYSEHSLPLMLAFCGDTSPSLVGITVPSGTVSNACHAGEKAFNTFHIGAS